MQLTAKEIEIVKYLLLDNLGEILEDQEEVGVALVKKFGIEIPDEETDEDEDDDLEDDEDSVDDEDEDEGEDSGDDEDSDDDEDDDEEEKGGLDKILDEVEP